MRIKGMPVVLYVVTCLLASTAPLLIYAQTPRLQISKEEQAKYLNDYIVGVIQKIPTTPGLAVAVVQGDKVVFLQGFGFRNLEAKLPVTPQTQFYIASTTKSFTGTAAKMLADEKKIDLDTPIKKYFPNLILPTPLSTEQISLRDLLTHRSGIRNEAIALRTAYTGQAGNDTILRLLANHSRATSPEYQYSNLGYLVAALAMEMVGKEPWQKILENKIFVPLEMKNTSAYMSRAKTSGNFALPYSSENGKISELPIKEDNTMHAAGGIVSSAEDMAKWLIFNMNHGRLNGKQIMAAASLDEVLSPQINQSRSFYKFKRYAYGLGWNLGTYGDDRLVHCFGEFAGFRPHVSFMPEHNIGIVVLANESSEGIFLPDLIAADIYDFLRKKQPFQIESNPKIDEILSSLEKEREENRQKAAKAAAEPTSAPMSRHIDAYAGTFENDELGTILVSSQLGSLSIRFGNLASALEHKNGDTFRASFKVLSPVEITFKDTNGVMQLSLIGRTFFRK